MNSEAGEKCYRKVADVAEVPRNTGAQVMIDETEIALFNVNGDFYAISNYCPHRGAPLHDGFLEQDKVFCSWHCFDFNLKTGECQMVPSLRVATYPVKIENGAVFICTDPLEKR